MLNLQERIREVNQRFEYWEAEVERLAVDKTANVYQKAREQFSSCLDELICLQDELPTTEDKTPSGVDSRGVLRYSLRFYGDGPEGFPDNLFCYPVHHGGHMADLLTRIIAKRRTVKAVFLVGGAGGGRGTQLSKSELDYLRCPGEREQGRIRAILMSKFPKLEYDAVKKDELLTN